jgi:uncharacterized protein
MNETSNQHFNVAKITNSKDLIMLLLYAPGTSGQICDPIEGQTRLMKMIFLFKKELSRRFNLDQVIDEKAFPDFKAYDYGPYSASVYSDLEFLVNLNFVEVILAGEPEILEEERQEFEYWSVTKNEDEDLDAQYLGRQFRLTDLGRKFVEQELIKKKGVTPEQLKVLGDFKKRCCESSLRSLLRYVYARYEDMTEKSKIKHEVLR